MRLQRKIAAKTESTWSLHHHHHQQQQQRHSSSNSNNRARSSHHSFKLSSLIYPHSAIRLLVTSTLIQMILITNPSPILCGEQWPPIIQFQSLKWEEDIMVPGASDNCTLLPTPLGTPSPVSTAAVSLPSSSPALGGGHMALDLAVSSTVTTIHRKEKR